VRSNFNTRLNSACISLRRPTVSLLLSSRFVTAGFTFTSSSYITSSLRLAGLRPRRINGRVVFSSARNGSRRLVQFVDTAGILRRQRGKTVTLTAVLRAGFRTACFSNTVRVC
jgi:hypothetical protein